MEHSIPAGAMVHAVPDQLLRAISNVIRNAIRYAAEGGRAAAENAEGGGLVVKMWLVKSIPGL